MKPEPRSAATKPQLVAVCLACGKVKGEHRGWDVSCEINSRVFPTDHLVRDPESGIVREVKEEPI